MPQFNYTARDQKGKIFADLVEAASREAVGQMLRGQGLLPTSIKEKKNFSFSLASVSRLFTHVSLLEKLTFTKNLAVALRAGLPVSRALNVIPRQISHAD